MGPHPMCMSFLAVTDAQILRDARVGGWLGGWVDLGGKEIGGWGGWVGEGATYPGV